MTKPTLVIMAAGLGSRYGGLKQFDPIGPGGEIIMDYSIYDAIRAGFGRVVFIINKDIEEVFKRTIVRKIQKAVDTACVYQSVLDIPEGFKVPEGRIKPWGTAHAVLTCKNVVDTPFAVINADDFYGMSSFIIIGDYLKNLRDSDGVYRYCMVGFKLENTLTENGHVARGVCSVAPDGTLRTINERTKIRKFEDGAKYTEDGQNWVAIPAGSTVSMNMWGFAPSIFKELESQFPEFLSQNSGNLEKAEYFLPSVMDRLISAGKAEVKVLTTDDRWYGVTYREDKPVVMEAVNQMIKRGIYPNNLWEGGI